MTDQHHSIIINNTFLRQAVNILPGILTLTSVQTIYFVIGHPAQLASLINLVTKQITLQNTKRFYLLN